MNYIRIVKIINRFSIIFMIINFIVALKINNEINSLFFLWVCGFSFLIYIIDKKKKWAVVLMGLLSFLPLILTKSLYILAIEAAAILCGFYISYKEAANLDYESEIDAFKRGLIICLGVFLLSLMTISAKPFSKYSAKYILLYFVSSIILLRTLRFIKYNRHNKDAKKNK